MKAVVLLLAVVGLSGCIAVPIAEPSGVYVGVPAPTVVVRPYVGGYYGYRGGYRSGYRSGDRHHWR
ncbi:MAG: hypothetical protein A2Z64_09910 [Betaproteobacteria bacterium RIFCSPLOWO2_02_67_12]|nr:MAG: hypothetical protein A2Z64_09910 [Betaproteobacteria bacterium RIFCSPLOWO2_02_67_12]OGA70418.1 MAG: hypothetical protein A3F77_15830 [Betaproteobacteria bacterium RIFCSPLOWO2_12_FULL_67_28]